MSEPLHTKYRPREFSDMVGQDLAAAVLAKMVAADDVPVGLLFTGTHGTGKTSAGRILARALEAEESLEEMDAASNGGVAEVRRLIDSLRYGHAGKHRVVIIDECHSMSRDAFNALLKTLEEPPSGTIFVLITTEPHKVPDTVLSRLVTFEFGRVSPDQIAGRLGAIREQEKISADDELLLHIAARSSGSVRDAIQLLDQCARAEIQTVERYRELKHEKDYGPLLVAALATGNHEKIFSTLDGLLTHVGSSAVILDALIDTVRDLLVLRAGGQLSVVGEELATRQYLASRLTPDQLTAVVRLLWDMKTRMRFHDNAASSLTLALVLISEIFSKG